MRISIRSASLWGFLLVASILLINTVVLSQLPQHNPCFPFDDAQRYCDQLCSLMGGCGMIAPVDCYPVPPNYICSKWIISCLSGYYEYWVECFVV